MSSNLVFANSGSEALKSSAVVPPQTVLDSVLKDLFHEGAYIFFSLLLYLSYLILR